MNLFIVILIFLVLHMCTVVCVCVTAPGPGAYIHYTLTGYVDHDSSKFREPAYTMRPALFISCNIAL